MCNKTITFILCLVRATSFSAGYSLLLCQSLQINQKQFKVHIHFQILYLKDGKKYIDLKEEILSNTDNEIVTVKIWNDMVILKAKEFIKTTKVKR